MASPEGSKQREGTRSRGRKGYRLAELASNESENLSPIVREAREGARFLGATHKEEEERG
jgi:hypothetical protein